MRCPDPACDGCRATYFQPPWSVERTSSKKSPRGWVLKRIRGTKSCVMGQPASSARSASALAAMTTKAVIGCLTAGVGKILGPLQG